MAVSGLPQVILQEFGTPEQQVLGFEDSLKDSLSVGFALSEPDSGSDAGSLTTVAEYDSASNTYRLNGRKILDYTWRIC